MFSKHFKKIYKKDKEYIAPTRCLPRLSMNVLVLTKKKKKKGCLPPLNNNKYEHFGPYYIYK
jgi:hypothetical protein